MSKWWTAIKKPEYKNWDKSINAGEIKSKKRIFYLHREIKSHEKKTKT